MIIAGALALAYGSFSFTRDTHQAKIGPIELSVKEKETVNIPVWAGLGAVLIGVVLLVVGKGKYANRRIVTTLTPNSRAASNRAA